MKVQVRLRTTATAGEQATPTIDLIVNDADTVAIVKERVATRKKIPFPELDLMLDGEVLAEGQRPLFNCGLPEEGSALDLVVRATEETLVRQLSELLLARDLSADELGLLYCYKFGASVKEALSLLGLGGSTLQDFLKTQKTFLLEGGRVTLVREDTSLKPFSVVEEVARILRASPSGTMEIKDLCAKFSLKFNISIESVAGMRPTEFLSKERDMFMVQGRRLVTLKSSICGPENGGRCPPQPPTDNGRVDEGLQMLPNPDPPPGLGPDSGPKNSALKSLDNQLYLDLHNKIFRRCGGSSNAKVSQVLYDIIQVISEVSFLNIDHVAKGGSVGKGTLIAGVADAEVTVFLQGLPFSGHERWLPPLLKAMAGTLKERLDAEDGVTELRATDDSVQMRVMDLITLDLRFSPVFESYSQTIQVLAEQGPDARKYYTASLLRERSQFVSRQPGQVKVTIRLLKWWRDQQGWSSSFVRPTDEILELMAIYSAVQTKPTDQSAAIASVMSLLARFDELRVVWSNYYTKDDVWAPLLRQRPLLMDPTNPFVNVADPQFFDARELRALATSTRFFW